MMSPAEIDEFLAEPRYLGVTTLRADGAPVTIFVGFEWSEGAIYFNLLDVRRSRARLRGDDRVALAVTNEFYPSRSVSIIGRAETIDDDPERSRRIFMRYMDPEVDFQRQKDFPAEAAFEASLSVPKTCFRVVPETLTSWDAQKL
jgi:nitroimidazol reductase NimA-like FMN-containing flavoprotein (pyridoxamine 5'-phosphate oxidase superfamily)